MALATWRGGPASGGDRARSGIWLVALWLAACGPDASARVVMNEVTGRVFSVDSARPLEAVEVKANKARSVKTTANGSFAIKVPANEKAELRASADNIAPVTKEAPPRKGGYLELHAKEIDLRVEIAIDERAELHTKQGAGISLPKQALASKDDSRQTKANVKVAALNLKAEIGVQSLPGNFDAKDGASVGKLSARAAVYVAADAGGKELFLTTTAKIALERKDESHQKAAGGSTLFRFDEASGTWVAIGVVESEINGQGLPVYTADVSQLGWFAVGDLLATLSCLRGCVEPASGSARIVARGVGLGIEAATYSEEDGCFVLAVPASSSFSVSAHLQTTGSEAVLAMSGAMQAEGDSTACTEVGPLPLTSRSESCPQGLTQCGQQCVDLAFDPLHCGACQEACGAVQRCVVGMCTSESSVGMDDGGVGARDGGNTAPDAEVRAPDAGTGRPDAGAPQLDSGMLDAAPPFVACGDGLLGGDEGCDDGNLIAGDGCNDACDVEVYWQCPVAGAACDGICGDEQIIGTEECDDGNAVPTDGCHECSWIPV